LAGRPFWRATATDDIDAEFKVAAFGCALQP
jgi:hypothetical protein